MQQNNQNRPCKVELEFPKIVFFSNVCLLGEEVVCKKISKTNGYQSWPMEKKTSFFIIFLIICLLGKDFVCNKMTLLFYDGASDFFCWDCCFTTMPAIFFWEIAILRRCQANFFYFFTKNTNSPTGNSIGGQIYRLVIRSSRPIFWFFYKKHKFLDWE